ncbi:MAG: outer membrane lipoprotein carrier protein LolA [Microvirga sp.]
MPCRPGPETSTARAAPGVGAGMALCLVPKLAPNLALSLVIGLALASTPALASDPLTQFLNGIFRREAPEAPAPAPDPAPDAAPAPAARPRAPRASRPATAAPIAATPPAAASPAPDAPSPAAAAAEPAPEEAPAAVASLPARAPLPPRRPGGAPGVAMASAETAAPLVQPAAVQPAAMQAPPAPSLPASPAAAIDRVNAFFNSIDLMTANFSQQSGTGQRTEGSLYIKYPGQLRFAYSPPSTLEIVSDGRSVAVRDKKLGTNDVYSVSQTPLKFLTQEQFNLSRDTKVRDVQVRPNGMVIVNFEDSATLGGTSKVTLLFDAKANRLREWTILDAQGFTTSVALSNISVTTRAGAP